jgi:plastocyanin
MKHLYKILIASILFFNVKIITKAAVVKIYIDEEKNLFTPANATAQVGDTIQWRRMPGQTSVHELHSIWITSPDPEKSKYEYFYETDTLYTYTVADPGNYNIHCYPHGSIMKGTISVSSVTTGNIREEKTPSVSFYPNPVKSVMNIDLSSEEEWTLQIHNIEGKEVKNEFINEKNHQINLELLSPGFYTIVISDGKRKRKENFIKE